MSHLEHRGRRVARAALGDWRQSGPLDASGPTPAKCRNWTARFANCRLSQCLCTPARARRKVLPPATASSHRAWAGSNWCPRHRIPRPPARPAPQRLSGASAHPSIRPTDRDALFPTGRTPDCCPASTPPPPAARRLCQRRIRPSGGGADRPALGLPKGPLEQSWEAREHERL